MSTATDQGTVAYTSHPPPLQFWAGNWFTLKAMGQTLPDWEHWEELESWDELEQGFKKVME